MNKNYLLSGFIDFFSNQLSLGGTFSDERFTFKKRNSSEKAIVEFLGSLPTNQGYAHNLDGVLFHIFPYIVGLLFLNGFFKAEVYHLNKDEDSILTFNKSRLRKKENFQFKNTFILRMPTYIGALNRIMLLKHSAVLSQQLSQIGNYPGDKLFKLDERFNNNLISCFSSFCWYRFASVTELGFFDYFLSYLSLKQEIEVAKFRKDLINQINHELANLGFDNEILLSGFQSIEELESLLLQMENGEIDLLKVIKSI